MTLPDTMQAVQLVTVDEQAPVVEVRTVPVPRPGPGQVLVRVAAAPLHPGDRMLCRGHHGFRRPVPTTLGLEGSGEVVEASGGLLARGLVGRRVAFLTDPDGDGSFAPWVAVQADRCLPAWSALSDAQAALMLLGPCTAIGLLDEADRLGHKGVVVTAASGVIGQLILRLAAHQKRPAVALVVGEDRAARVRAMGVEHVVDMEDADADGQLRRAVRAVQASCVLDAVGGETASRALAALPEGGDLVHHGTLSGTAPQVDADDLVYRRKSVRGYWFEDRLRTDGIRARLAWLPRLRALSGELGIDVREELSLGEVPAAMSAPTRGTGRHLVRPGLTLAD